VYPLLLQSFKKNKMSLPLHSVDNSLFITNNQSSASEFTTKEINLEKNLLSEALDEGGFFTYLDNIAQNAISTIDQKGIITPPNNVNLTLTLADAGKTVLLPASGGNLFIFLPPMNANLRGCKFTMILTAANNVNFWQLNTNNAAHRIFGHVFASTPASQAGTSLGNTGSQFANFTGNAANSTAGDRIDIISDGTAWYLIGKERVQNGIF
jgi:hypothetical protein